MKTTLKLAVIAALAYSTTTFAAKEVTLTGEGKCLKCALKKADKCQNVLEVKEGDKTKLYWLVGPVSKDYHHDNLCSATKKITVTGEVKEEDGTLKVQVAKIEDAK